MQRHVHTLLLDTHSANATDAVRLISTRITFQCHQIMQPGGYVDVRNRLPSIANFSLKSILKKKNGFQIKLVFSLSIDVLRACASTA
jgi:hypothetical protein